MLYRTRYRTYRTAVPHLPYLWIRGCKCRKPKTGTDPSKEMKGRENRRIVFNRQTCRLLLLLTVLCFGFYIMMYCRASHSSQEDSTSQGNHCQLKNGGQLNASEQSAEQNNTIQYGVTAGHWNERRWQSLAALYHSILSGESPPLLTLFSSWINSSDLELVRELTLRNWAMLRPFVLPVLFTNDSGLARQAVQSGWETLPVSRIADGVPVLRHMYMDVRKRFDSTLLAFANGDLLFTDDLIKTLLAILSDPSLPLDQHPMMVTGRRTMVQSVTAFEASSFTNIKMAARKRGKLYHPMSKDYFITNRHFPWSEMPDVAIARTVYDNWLVLHSIQEKHVVVDITNTSVALHQTVRLGHSRSLYNENTLKKLYKQIDYFSGSIVCTPWLTLKKPDGSLQVERRTQRPKYCRQDFV